MSVGLQSLVSMWRFIYRFLNVCPFDYTTVVIKGKVDACKPHQFEYIIGTDCPKSVCNTCVMEVSKSVVIVFL